jgi:hypothetical protein
MPDPIKDLYNSLKSTKIFLDENDFRQQLSKSPKEVFDVVSKEKQTSGLFIDYDDFENATGLKKKEPLGVGGGAGISEAPLGLRPAKIQPTIFKEPSVGEDTVLARKLAKEQRAAVATTGVKLPAAPKIIAEEKAAERALAPKLPASKEDIGELEGLSNAINRGVLQGNLADMMALGQMPKREDIKEIARINRELSSIPSTGAYERFNTGDLKSSIKEFVNNPIEITSQLIGESLAAQLRHGYSRALAGLGTGATLGSVIPGIGTAAGAGTGFIAGMGVAGYNLEMASSIMDSFREAGVDVTDEQSLTKAFDDPATLRKAREFANKRAVPIALFDMFSAGMGGKLLGKPAKTMLGKVGRVSGEVGVQMGLAGGGETTAQLVSGQKINPTAILSEMIGEAGGGAPDIVVGTMIEKKKMGQPIKKEAVQLDVKPEDLQEMLDISEASGEITDAQANDIKKEYEDIQKVKQAVPEEFKKNSEVIEALEQKRQLEAKKQGLDPVFAKKIDEQIKSLDTKIDDIVAAGEVAPQISKEDASLLELSLFPKYRVEYFDPTKGEMTHSFFDTKEEGDRFMSSLTDQQRSRGVQAYFQRTTEPSLKVGEVAPEGKPEVPAAPVEALKNVESTAKALEERRLKKGEYEIFQARLSADGETIYEYSQAIKPSDVKEFDGYFYSENPSGGISITEKSSGFKLVEGNNKKEALQKFKDLINQKGGLENLKKESQEVLRDRELKFAESYQKAKTEGINPELVKAVEDLLVGEVAPEAKPELPAAPEKTEEINAQDLRQNPNIKLDVTIGYPESFVGLGTDRETIARENNIDASSIKIGDEVFLNNKKYVVKSLPFTEKVSLIQIDESGRLLRNRDLKGKKIEEPEFPAAPVEEELPFGEGREIKTRKKRQITNKKRRALNIEIVDNPRGEVLQYFIGDGKVSEKSLANFFESEKQGYRWEKSKEEEKKLRKSLTSKNPKAPSIEELAEKIAGVDRFDRVQDFRNAIEEVLLNHNRAETMADELVRDYDLEFAEMEKAAELEEVSKEIEEEAQAFVSQIPPAQQEEILKVLNRFRYNDGFINWRQIGEEIKDGFEPVILELSEPSQKIINDAIKQFEETGRVGRISPEALPTKAKAGDAARNLAERIRAGKITRKGLQVSTGLDAIWDAALEVVATSLEAGASIADAIQDGIRYIRSTDFYKSATNKKQIEDNFENQLNEEYAIQEQAAGEIPVQPEAGTRGKVEAGVPPTRPKKSPEEGEAEVKEEIEYTPRDREKALLNNLYKAKNIPEDARIGFEKEGLKYQTKSQKEAELVAKTVIDQIGIDEALKFADSFKFDGDVNSLIYAESLNRLAKMEREAKSPKEKQSLAKKFAEVGIQYGIKSQYGGRFNAAINYFYQKSPLGVVLMEDMKRKEEFNKFAKNKEQSWKEAHDIIKAELDALKRELEGKKIEPSIKTSEAKIMAARLKRVALKEKYKKGKGGGLTLTTGGLTKEGIEYVGELVATYIEEGIANVEVIIQRIFLDFKDVTGKNLDEKTANQVEEEVRKKYKETKGKSVLNKIRKKLEKLSKKKQDEVIRKSFTQIIESGGLEYDDFRKIVAEVTGYAELTNQEKVRLEELVTKTNAVERMAEKAREDRTEQSLRDFRKAEMEAGKAARELNQLVWNKPDILKRLTSIMQLSTLGIPALINNPIYNIWNQATLRFPVGLINDLVDRGITLSAQATGTEYQREYNTLDTQKEFFKKLGFGTKESVEQLITGLNRQDYIQKEVGGQQIQPLQAAKDWWASFTGKKKLTTAQAWDKAIQATVGVPAEVIARTLNIGDKPQRFAAEGAQAAAFAKSFGLKDLDYKLFIEFPKEEAFRVYKSRGLSDAEAAQKAEYIKNVIIKEGQRATFQQDNLVNTALSAVFNTIFGKGKETGLANLVKTVTISPYIKIPTNAYWSYYNLVNPEIALLQSFAHGGRAFYLNKSGEKNQAKLALRESRYWLAHSITGMAMKAVVIALVKAAVYNPGSDEEESKREREGKAFFEGQGTVNVDKLNAILAGEDPTQVKNGLLIPNRWFGQWGTVGNAIARKYENMTPEQRKTEADYYDFMLGEMATDVLQEMEQGVFANTSSLLSLLQTGNPNRYLTNTLNMFTNIVHPAALAQISRAQIPNYTTQKADTFLKELENAMLTRSSFMRELMAKYPPSKISIWGEPIQKQGATIQKLFNITRVNKDMFARPIYDDAKKYNDINFFPPAITSSLNGKQLTVDQTKTLQEFVGQARKARIAPYINDSAVLEGFNVKYSDLSDPEDKKKVLNYLYEVGRKDGIERFYNQYKDLKPKEKTEDFLKELQFDLFKTLQKYKQKNSNFD